jgi:hypothetical protein
LGTGEVYDEVAWACCPHHDLQFLHPHLQKVVLGGRLALGAACRLGEGEGEVCQLGKGEACGEVALVWCHHHELLDLGSLRHHQQVACLACLLALDEVCRLDEGEGEVFLLERGEACGEVALACLARLERECFLKIEGSFLPESSMGKAGIAIPRPARANTMRVAFILSECSIEAM